MPYNLRKRPPPVVESTPAPTIPKRRRLKADKNENEVKAEKEVKAAKAVKAEAVPSQYCFGDDTCGELGLGKIGVTRKEPTLISIPEPVQKVVCGPMHTLSLTVSGKIFSYGCNDEGALGRVTDGDEILESKPTVVPLSDKVIKVTAGDSHSAVLTDKHEVYIWGNFRDEHGSVGLTPECNGKPIFKPMQILAGTEFNDIASGSNHMLLLDIDGIVYTFGVGEQGQLGRLRSDQVEKGVKIMDENRELFLVPQKVNFKDVDPQRTFICDAVYAGNFSSFATNTDKKKNRLAGWGLNNHFQLGYKGQKDQLVQYSPKRSTFTCSTSMVGVACGQHHTLFLTKTGRVYAAGKHLYGMLGLGKLDKEVCPAKQIASLGNTIVDISAGINTSFAVDGDGKLFAWGMGGTQLGLKSDDDLLEPTVVKSLEGKNVKYVSAGASFTAVLAIC